MASYLSDRRLYLTASKDRVVEHGDPRAAFLLAGEGCEIGASEVERLGLSRKDGRMVYPGYKSMAPSENKMAPKPEDKAAGTAASGEWSLKMSPEEYLSRFPDGPNAELARTLVGSSAPAG